VDIGIHSGGGGVPGIVVVVVGGGAALHEPVGAVDGGVGAIQPAAAETVSAIAATRIHFRRIM